MTGLRATAAASYGLPTTRRVRASSSSQVLKFSTFRVLGMLARWLGVSALSERGCVLRDPAWMNAFFILCEKVSSWRLIGG